MPTPALASAITAAAPRNSRPGRALPWAATRRWQRRARRAAAWVRSLDLSHLRHLAGYGIACSGLVVILAGLIDPSAA